MITSDMFDPFDLTLGRALKERGIKRAATAKQDLLKLGRLFIRRAAEQRADQTATADDAARGFVLIGMPADILGNAAGALFREKCWRFDGYWKESKRISNHGHRNRVWHLIIE